MKHPIVLFLTLFIVFTTAAFCSGSPLLCTRAMAEEEEEGEEGGDEAPSEEEQLAIYRKTVTDGLDSYMNKVIRENGLSESDGNKLRSILQEVGLEIYTTEDMTRFADMAGAAMSRMDAVAEESKAAAAAAEETPEPEPPKKTQESETAKKPTETPAATTETASSDQQSTSVTASAPHLTVTGYQTEPEQVLAGGSFTIALHLQNLSASQSASGVAVDVQAVPDASGTATIYSPFVPVAGAGAINIGSVAPQETRDLRIEMNAGEDLEEKTYTLRVRMTYYGTGQTELEDTALVSIPVRQAPRCEIGEISLTPDTIRVGEQSRVSFSINNTGRSTLHNVWIRFRGNSINGGNSFLGEIFPGETRTLDTSVTGVAETGYDGSVIAEISIENEQGTKSTIEKELHLTVYPEAAGSSDMGTEEEIQDVTHKKKRGPVVLLILLFIAVLIALMYIFRKKILRMILRMLKRYLRKKEMKERQMEGRDVDLL